MRMITEWVTLGIEVVGISIIVIGALMALGTFVIRYMTGCERADRYYAFRAHLGRSILLGLEFLVAADIIATVAMEPTLNSVMVLAVVVLIRTFLSFALEVEIEGKLPWRRGAVGYRGKS